MARFPGLALALMLAGPLLSSQAGAATCGGDFNTFMSTFQREAAAKGVSQKVISAAFAGLTPDPKVLELDRNQKPFKMTFEEFAARRVSGQRLKKGGTLLLANASMLSRIEEQFGVPGEVLVAIWGLETDYGVNMGKQSAIRSLATLAHDCRRTDLFQGELLAALQFLERGDLRLEDMKGAWAGELGQTQFLASSYLKFGVDFDGNGRRDLIRSVPDVLASTANYLKGYGWQAGAPYTEGSANFEALKNWNKSSIYQRTIALFAQKLASGQ
jgi:lytic murein transglycosylase